jgi:transposase
MPSQSILDAWKSPHRAAREAERARKKQELPRLLKQGLTSSQLATRLGVDISTIGNWRRELAEQQA